MIPGTEKSCFLADASVQTDTIREPLCSLVKNIPGAVFRCVREGGKWAVLYISDAVEEITGRPAAEFLRDGRCDLLGIVCPEDLPGVCENLEEIVRGPEPYMMEYRILDREGKVRWVCEKGRPVFDGNGALRWRDGVLFDITLQREAEERHRSLAFEYEAIARAVTDVMFTADVGGCIMHCNENLSLVTGHALESVRGMPVEALFIADRRHDVAMMLARCLDKGRAEMEVDLLTQSGPVPHHVKMVVLRDDQGSIRGIAGSGRDLSHYKRLEKQLRQSQKMQAIGQLTGGIAHDFNNFLTAIIGFTDLARQRNLIHGDEKIAMYLDEVYKAGGRAQGLVSQMLAFSRGGESEAVPLQPLPVLKETLKMLSASLPSSIRMQLQDCETEAQIMADPLQLQQVIMNLCINARDAMNGEGEISLSLGEKKGLRAECSSCHDTLMGDFVVITVRDSGCGIGEDILERIFEPFFSTKPQGKGTGMGLSMVHGIIHQCGGHILVESRPGSGTAFHLLFPRIAATGGQQEEDAATPVQADHALHGRVLIVDDEPAVAGFLSELLHSRGCETVVFEDSREALAAFKKDPAAFDLVITDQTMPGMSGAVLAQEMLMIRPDLPIALCTGYSEQIDEMRARMLGIRRYLTKPIDVMAFLDAVNELLDYRPPGQVASRLA